MPKSSLPVKISVFLALCSTYYLASNGVSKSIDFKIRLNTKSSTGDDYDPTYCEVYENLGKSKTLEECLPAWHKWEPLEEESEPHISVNTMNWPISDDDVEI
eukprot:CAMPEP_0171610302 /NCGR_PEP_ID=MMETSP0990-20121206/9973_1 /TAXON_ID=483369 /ORGANISM="non described non described, Strain CCMP2098" /LENGTH=101 /DNA_ID=CAMNT_0012173695 /DNA_START=23 /DNA_END=328 /DNA_ORIENTATION=+